MPTARKAVNSQSRGDLPARQVGEFRADLRGDVEQQAERPS
jgi:hypothetical protein